MAEKLSITIALEGAAEIERQLEGIGQAGTKAFGEIAKAAEKTGGFDKLDPKDISAKLEKFGVTGKAAIDKITAAVASAGRLERIVGGVRQVEAGFAGIGAAASAMATRVVTAGRAAETAIASLLPPMTAVRSAFRAFGLPLTIGGLGAAAVGMEKMADAARVLEGNLQALFKSQAGGTAFFNQIQSAAQSAGASLEATAKTMVGIVQTIQKELQAKGFRFAPGEGLKQAAADAQKVFDTLQKGMQLSGTRADDATKAIAKLFDEIKTKGALSGDSLRKLAAEFPQLANELVKALGRPGESMEQLAARVDKGLAKIDLTKFINAIKRVAPEVQKLSDAFEPTLAQRMDIISGAWDRLLNSFGKSPAGAAIKGAMDDIAKGLDEIAKKQEQIGKFTVDKPPETTTGKLLQQTFDEFNQNIEIAKQNWERLKNIVTSPIELVLGFASLTPAGLAINAVLKLIEKIRSASKDKITVPFEADPEPPFIQAYLTAIEKVKAAFKSIFTPDVAPAEAPEPPFVQAYLTAVEKVKAALSAIFTPTVAPLGAPEPAFVQTYLAAIAKVKAAFQTIFTPSVALEGAEEPPFVQTYLAAIETVKTALSSISWDTITSAGAAAWNAVTSAVQAAGSAIQQFASSLASISWGLISAGAAAWDAVTSAIGRAIAAIRQFLGLQAGGAAGGAAGGQVGGFQSGGLLGGRGTGTSDSNLIRVSRGEYIVPARAVRQPGVLAFLEALRRSGGNLRDVLDDMGRFALGGLVPRTIPAFATGGLAHGGMSNVTIQFPGLPPIEGLRASEKVIDELRKAAALAQVRSGGRKPSRYT